MRRLAFVFGLVFVLSSPGVALAATGDIFDLGPEIAFAGTGREGWVYYAGAPFDSTFSFLAAVCGVDWENDLNSSQRDWLSNTSVAFRSLANNPDYCGSLLSQEPFASLSILDAYWQFWGTHTVYLLGCPADVLDVARVELHQVMNGTVDNKPVINGRTYQFELSANYYTHDPSFTPPANSSHYSGTDGTIYTLIIPPRPGWVQAPNTITMTFTDTSTYDYQDGYDLYAIVSPGPGGATAGRGVSFEVFALPKDKYQIVEGTETSSSSPYQTGKTRSFYVEYGVTYYRYINSYNVSTMDTTLDVSAKMSSLSGFGYQGQGQSVNTIGTYGRPYGFFGDAPVQIPTTPDPQPDPPIQPPDPGTDVPTVNPPTWPTIELPDIDVDLPSVDIDWPTLADGLDYTDLLRTIIARLESIGDILGTIDEDLATHCQHLQRQIHEQAKYLGNLIVQGLHSDLSFLGTQIQSAYKSINRCIREQVAWLASQLQWVVNYDSDLGALEFWLQRTWSKIGKGSYLQPDPVTDEPGFLDWLEKLWEHIMGLLSEITDGALDELLVVLDDLAHRFPFSIPWDVMALLALFAHTPEPIAFTITLPDVPGLYGGVIEVDCSGWDWMAGMVRPVLLVMFAYRLAMWTPKALESLGLLGEFKRSE